MWKNKLLKKKIFFGIIALSILSFVMVGIRKITKNSFASTRLQNLKGKNLRIVDQKYKATVLFSYNLECPIARKQISDFKKLITKFGNEIKFFLLVSNDTDSIEKLLKQASEYQIPTDILLDRDKSIAQSLKINRTATAILIDSKEKAVRYSGALSNRFDYSLAEKAEGSYERYLENALESYLKDETIKLNNTQVSGCLI